MTNPEQERGKPCGISRGFGLWAASRNEHRLFSSYSNTLIARVASLHQCALLQGAQDAIRNFGVTFFWEVMTLTVEKLEILRQKQREEELRQKEEEVPLVTLTGVLGREA